MLGFHSTPFLLILLLIRLLMRNLITSCYMRVFAAPGTPHEHVIRVENVGYLSEYRNITIVTEIRIDLRQI